MTDIVRAETSKRLYYLDWLRVLIIFGVFFAHALLPFTGADWLINTDNIFFIAPIIALVGNQFGMPLLFLISGAGAYFALRKRNGGQFAKERALRLIVPYIVAVFLLSPIQGFFADIHHGVPVGNFITYYPNFFTLDKFTGFNLQWAGMFGYHLWFLVFLFFYSIVSLPLMLWLKTASGQRVLKTIVRINRIPGMLLLWVIPVAIAQILLRADYTGYQDWADTVFWGFFFVFGYISFADPELIQSYRKNLWTAILAIILSVVGLIFIALNTFFGLGDLLSIDTLSVLLLDPNLLTESPELTNIIVSLYVVGLFCITLNTWAFLVLFVSLGQRLLNFTNRHLANLSDISLPFYLLHHPVVVVVGFFVIRLGFDAYVEVAILITSGLIITLGLIQYFIKPYDPLRVILGMRPLSKVDYKPPRRLIFQQVGFGLSTLAFVIFLYIIMQNPQPIAPPVADFDPPVEPWQAVIPEEETTCIEGDFRFFTRQVNEGERSDQLMVYFQTGGACWDSVSCGPNSIIYDRSINNREMDTYKGIFDFENPANPLLDYDMVFVPYCTGDLHSGENNQVYTDMVGNDLMIPHQGAQNAKAVLNWVYENYPEPEKILVTGSSAGSVGGIYWSAEIMSRYPDTEFVQFGDGLVGVMPNEFSGFDRWNTEANLFPALADKVFVGETIDSAKNLYRETARLYPQWRFGQFSHGADAFQLSYFNIAGGDLLLWADQLRNDLDELDNDLDNFYYYVGPGVLHTILAFNQFYNMEVDGVVFSDWFTAYLNGDPVETVQCPRGTVDCP